MAIQQKAVPTIGRHRDSKIGKRPLRMPTWSDKIVAEVVRLLLEAYYEPTFSDRSHGFRPGRGCHTVLTEVVEVWKGTLPLPITSSALVGAGMR
jgi:hypothetical protein